LRTGPRRAARTSRLVVLDHCEYLLDVIADVARGCSPAPTGFVCSPPSAIGSAYRV